MSNVDDGCTTDGRGHDVTMFTLAHLIDSFTAHLRIMVRAGVTAQSTMRWYQDQFRHLRALKDLPAESLRTHHLVTIDLTNAFCRALKRVFKWGAAEDLIPKDPFAKLAIPPCGARTRVLTRPELRRLYLSATRAFRRLLFVQLHTIARPGEVRNLTWSQIDWDKRCIMLAKFKGQAKRRDKLKARPIPLSVTVLRFLRNLRRKAADTSPDARVFISERGGRPWTPNGVRCAMREARRRAGLVGGGERVVCYTLRHTGATEAIRATGDIHLVAGIMGHARTSTTERYLHRDTSDLVAGMDKIHSRPGKVTAV